MVMGEMSGEAELLVVGGGPGGYVAAFRAADLGMDVTLVDAEERLGGVCLLRGCIPSKALLHLAELRHEAAEAAGRGMDFGEPDIDREGVAGWVDDVVGHHTEGLEKLAESRGIRVVRGRARFDGPERVRIPDADLGALDFERCIVATGSRPTELPGLPFGGSVWDSERALALEHIPDRLLVVGAGYVGLELGQVYAALGSDVTVVEMEDRILPKADAGLVEAVADALVEPFEAVKLETSVEEGEVGEDEDGVTVRLTGPDGDEELDFDRVLVAVGRTPNTDDLGLEDAGIETGEDGFIRVDERRRTSVQDVWAVGDAAGGMLLAHEAMMEGRVAAADAAGEEGVAFDPRCVPAVVYTDPQIAWCGLMESEAREEEIEVEVADFPWSASGRASAMGAEEGITRLVVTPDEGRVLGVGVAGRDAEAVLPEGILAVEMGALARDLALTIHPHPGLSETLGEAAERFLGLPVHLTPGG